MTSLRFQLCEDIIQQPYRFVGFCDVHPIQNVSIALIQQPYRFVGFCDTIVVLKKELVIQQPYRFVGFCDPISAHQEF